MTSNVTRDRLWTRGDNLLELPLYKISQDTKRFCYARKDGLEQGAFKRAETLNLNLHYLKYKSGSGEKVVSVYTHYPGQFRTGSTRILLFPLKLLDKSNNNIEITLSQVVVIRKRADANIKCDPDNIDDDYQYRKAIVDNVGCTPSFWKSFFPVNNSLAVCRSSKQYEDILNWNLDLRKNEIRSLYDPPCNQMSLVGSFYFKNKIFFNQNSDKGENELLFRVYYPSQTYQEITNKKDFGFESLWSCIGGFVGIFLGYSLMQLPEILSDGVTFITNSVVSKGLVSPNDRRLHGCEMQPCQMGTNIHLDKQHNNIIYS